MKVGPAAGPTPFAPLPAFRAILRVMAVMHRPVASLCFEGFIQRHGAQPVVIHDAHQGRRCAVTAALAGQHIQMPVLQGEMGVDLHNKKCGSCSAAASSYSLSISGSTLYSRISQKPLQLFPCVTVNEQPSSIHLYTYIWKLFAVCPRSSMISTLS